MSHFLSKTTETCRDGSYSEKLIAVLDGGEVVQKHGYDTDGGRLGKVEVRSRMLGTDGRCPRLTTNSTKMKNSEYHAIIHFGAGYQIYEAILVPTSALIPLYNPRRQKKRDQAHIPFREIKSLKGTANITDRLIRIEAALLKH
jgi:hypothetical protein